jgi:ABC-type dipeptide/oligopeptide/nickel transport systems, permease components
MARHLLNRFLLTLPALWLVLSLVFLLIHIVPGDPVEQMLGEGAAPGQVAELRHSLGLDRPLLVQYGRYLWEVAHGRSRSVLQISSPGSPHHL